MAKGKLDNYHGSAGSPILYRDSVLLYPDHDKSSFVAAFDERTDKSLWRTERDASAGWGTPIVLDAGTCDELVVPSSSSCT